MCSLFYPTPDCCAPFCFTNYKGFDPEWASQNLQNGGPSSVTYQFGVNLKF